jgi:hypothetical protein
MRLPGWLVRAIMGEGSHVTLVSRRVSNRLFRATGNWKPRVPSARRGLAAVAREIAGG